MDNCPEKGHLCKKVALTPRMRRLYIGQVCAGVIEQENLFMAIPTLTHHRSTYLTQPHTMSPSCTLKEKERQAVCIDFFVNYKSRTVQMGFGQPTPDFKFLSDNTRRLVSNNTKFYKTP